MNKKPLWDLLHDNVKVRWKNASKTMFQQTKISITKCVTLTFSNTNHPFFTTVDYSLIGCRLSPISKRNKANLVIVSCDSRILTTYDEKVINIYRELIGIFCSFSIYEHCTMGSDHFNNLLKFCKPIPDCSLRKEINLWFSLLQKRSWSNFRNSVISVLKEINFL